MAFISPVLKNTIGLQQNKRFKNQVLISYSKNIEDFGYWNNLVESITKSFLVVGGCHKKVFSFVLYYLPTLLNV